MSLVAGVPVVPAEVAPHALTPASAVPASNSARRRVVIERGLAGPRSVTSVGLANNRPRAVRERNRPSNAAAERTPRPSSPRHVMPTDCRDAAYSTNSPHVPRWRRISVDLRCVGKRVVPWPPATSSISTLEDLRVGTRSGVTITQTKVACRPTTTGPTVPRAGRMWTITAACERSFLLIFVSFTPCILRE